MESTESIEQQQKRTVFIQCFHVFFSHTLYTTSELCTKDKTFCFLASNCTYIGSRTIGACCALAWLRLFCQNELIIYFLKLLGNSNSHREYCTIKLPIQQVSHRSAYNNHSIESHTRMNQPTSQRTNEPTNVYISGWKKGNTHDRLFTLNAQVHVEMLNRPYRR